MDFELFEEFVLPMAGRHQQRVAQIDERLAEAAQIQAGLAISHAKLLADLTALATRQAESAAGAGSRMAGHEAGMEESRKEARMLVRAIRDQTNRFMDRQTKHESEPGARRNLPRPA